MKDGLLAPIGFLGCEGGWFCEGDQKPALREANGREQGWKLRWRIDSVLGSLQNAAAALAETVVGIDQKKAEARVQFAHKICPYSNAIRGNVDVAISVSAREHGCRDRYSKCLETLNGQCFDREMLTETHIAQKTSTKALPVKCILLGSAFLVLAVMFYYNFLYFSRTSDDATIFLAGQEMNQGNWRLQGWWLPDDNYVPIDIFFYAAFTRILGPNPQILFYLPAALWAAVSVLSLYLAQDGLPKSQKKFAIIAVATPILFPLIRSSEKPGAVDPLAALSAAIAHSPQHIGTILYVLFCFALSKKILPGNSKHLWLMTIGYGLIMSFAVLADPLAIYIGALPVIFVAAFGMIKPREMGSKLGLVVVTLLAIILATLLLQANTARGGFHSVPVQMNFVPFARLGGTLFWTIQFFFQLFGCDFFGNKLLAFPTAIYLLRLPFLALLIAAIGFVTKNVLARLKSELEWPEGESEYLNVLLAVGLTTNVLAAVFSTMMMDYPVIRYLTPSLIFGSILIARTQLWTRWLLFYYCVALFGSLSFSLSACAQHPPSSVITSAPLAALSKWLSKNALTDGFGPYWSSAITTVASRNQFKVRAIKPDGQDGFKPFLWQANKYWYQSRTVRRAAVIFVLAREDEDDVREADVLRAFGEPKERDAVGPYTVNLYDSDNTRLRPLFIR